MTGVLIVDDEAPARRKLKRFLETDPEVTVLGEAANGAEALARVSELHPQIVFLDVEMPDMDGFAVAEALPEDERPRIIFVTAHDHYAYRAFQAHAQDYLLKPVDPQRFADVLSRAKKHLDNRDTEELRKLLRDLRSRAAYAKRILINTGDRAFFLAVEQIEWVDAERNYIHIHVRGEAGRKVHLMRSTIESFRAKLDPAQFARINRSQIVNLDCVGEMRPWFHGEYRVILQDGAELTWSRRFTPGAYVRP